VLPVDPELQRQVGVPAVQCTSVPDRFHNGTYLLVQKSSVSDNNSLQCSEWVHQQRNKFQINHEVCEI
jgi:hypothetical protein